MEADIEQWMESVPGSLLTVFVQKEKAKYEVMMKQFRYEQFRILCTTEESETVLKKNRISFEFHYLDFANDTYHMLTDTAVLVERKEVLCKKEQKVIGMLLTYRLENAGPYQDMIRFVTKQYMEYVWKKTNTQTASVSFAEEETAWEDEFAKDFQEWKKQIHRQDKDDEILKKARGLGYEIAVMLDGKEAEDAFLQEEKWEKFAQNTGCERIYLGNAYCFQMLPGKERWRSLFKTAQMRQLCVTIVLPPIAQWQFQDATELMKELLKFIFDDNLGMYHKTQQRVEVVVNDWGMLRFLIGEMEDFVIPVLGTHLIKRRKDPRYCEKAGYAKRSLPGMEFTKGQLEQEVFAEFLVENNIKKMMAESCDYPLTLDSRFESHLCYPFYQTNTSAYCPLRAMLVNGDRGKQSPDRGCSRFCETYVALYPEKVRAILRGNSIFSKDQYLSKHQELLEKYWEQGCRRLVWNLEWT